ncbi:uncharacterized protein C2orf50 homolog isoform X1 [Podarcis raffonei]|uniref:uncharacterized protein C2orf50 homolog isoform X1 n=1 Tax=Podarcis raffonei TaxID=65483 RepID=UPI0023291AA7|nr:uncharacterized protein C2orf50 homolog isoform X1 [Podarcis raffonei]
MLRDLLALAQASWGLVTQYCLAEKSSYRMGSRANGLRRTTSAGFRSPATSPADVNLASSSSPSLSSSQSARTLLATTQSSVKQSSKSRGGEEQEALKADQVRQDTVWREFVEAERRATRYWYRNWSFLKDYDPLGRIKEPEQLPEYMSVFSDKIPNTSGHVIGSRMNTDLGKTLVKMDYFLNYGRRKNKLGQELQAS